MGKGKGNVEFWVAVAKPGRVLFEIGGGVPEDIAKEALRLAAYKLAIKTQIIQREVVGEES
jgi:large subunit ribosomal protein L16